MIIRLKSFKTGYSYPMVLESGNITEPLYINNNLWLDVKTLVDITHQVNHVWVFVNRNYTRV